MKRVFNLKPFQVFNEVSLRVVGIGLVLSLSLFFSCKNDRYRQHRKPVASVCLSFDDYSVDEWFELRPLLLQYQARVTFFVTKFDTLSSDQVRKLRILQHDGHEIAFHGAKHVLSEYYIKKHSMDEYLQEEIIKGIRVMADSGFRVTSFAYPYSAKYWFTDHELLNYFYVLRSSLPLQQEITKMDKIFYPFEGGRLIMAACIDKGQGLNHENLEKAMSRAKKNKESLVLYGHQPGLTFDVVFLEQILSMAKTNGLEFLRVSDLVI